MRLVCPRCGAQYEIDDAAIPAQGRDVECSACDSVWRASRPFDPAARPALSRQLDESVLEILRQEAARELEARAAERAAERAAQRTAAALAQFQRPRAAADAATVAGPGTPPPPPAGAALPPPAAALPPPSVSPAAAPPAALPPPSVSPAAAPPAAPVADDTLPAGAGDDLPPRRLPAAPDEAPRADLLDDPGSPPQPQPRARLARPGFPAGHPVAAATPQPARPAARSRARRRQDAGFNVAVMAALVAVALYALAPRLADQGTAGGQLMAWRAQVDEGRDWLADRAGGLVDDGRAWVRALAE